MSKYRNLITGGECIPLLTDMAGVFSIGQALFLQQLHYWLNIKKKELDSDLPLEYREYLTKFHVMDNMVWIYKTNSEWVKEIAFFKKSAIRCFIRELKEMGVVLDRHFFNSQNEKNKYYTINYEKYDQIMMDVRVSKNDSPGVSKNDSPGVSKNDSPGVSKNDSPYIRYSENTNTDYLTKNTVQDVCSDDHTIFKCSQCRDSFIRSDLTYYQGLLLCEYCIANPLSYSVFEKDNKQEPSNPNTKVPPEPATYCSKKKEEVNTKLYKLANEHWDTCGWVGGPNKQKGIEKYVATLRKFIKPSLLDGIDKPFESIDDAHEYLSNSAREQWAYTNMLKAANVWVSAMPHLISWLNGKRWTEMSIKNTINADALINQKSEAKRKNQYQTPEERSRSKIEANLKALKASKEARENNNKPDHEKPEGKSLTIFDQDDDFDLSDMPPF